MKSHFAAAVLLPVFASAQIPGDENWLYGYPDTSAEPFTMETIGDFIYMGGLFLSVDGLADAKDFARFSLRTETWEAIPGFGSRDVGGVWAIEPGPDGNIYVGGNFADVTGVPSSAVACFNPRTMTWTGLTDNELTGGQENGPTNGRVLALAISGDWLYVGGEFTGPAGTPDSEKYIRRFDLQRRNWDLAVGGGLQKPDMRAGDVRALHVLPDGSVLAAGNIIGGVARWDGTSWATYAGGVGTTKVGNGDPETSPGTVRSIAGGQDGTLYFGGDFDRVGAGGAVEVSSVAQLAPDGSWDAMAGGFDDRFIQSNGTDFVSDGVWELGVDADGRVFAVGDFDANARRQNTNLRHVARWTGTGWTNLGSGVGLTGSQNVNCLTFGPSGKNLYIGGIFSSGFTAPNRRFSFVRWSDAIDFTDYVTGAYMASRTIRIRRQSAERVEVQAQLLPGRHYRLEGSSTLTGDWDPVGNLLLGQTGGNGVPIFNGFAFDTAIGTAFYRFRPVPSP